jgi:hypothetical protein
VWLLANKHNNAESELFLAALFAFACAKGKQKRTQRRELAHSLFANPSNMCSSLAAESTLSGLAYNAMEQAGLGESFVIQLPLNARMEITTRYCLY